MSTEQKERIAGWVFWTTLTVAIGLFVGGFFVPPTGIIDGSVLTAVGELFAFAALGVGLEAVRLGRNFRVSKGDIVAEITRKKGPIHANMTHYNGYGDNQGNMAEGEGLPEGGDGER